MAQVKFIDFDVWSLNQQWLNDYIDRNDAKAIKSAALSADKTKLLLYRVASPTSDTIADFEIEFPNFGDVTLDAFVKKLSSAKEDDVLIASADGSLKDSGIAITDLAKVSYVDEQIAKAKTETTHLTKEIVTSVPEASNAKENVIYMLKVEDAYGDDKYEEYMLIGGAVVMTGTTSTDLSNYYTKYETDGKIATAKQEAINTAAADATSKANQALADSKVYTDGEIGKLNTTISGISTEVSGIKTNIETINTTLTTYGDRISALETAVGDITVATEEEALAVFNSIFTS